MIDATPAAWATRLDAFNRDHAGGIEGWAQPIVMTLLPILLQTFHEAQGIVGGLAEIGVHHGKFFLALDALRRPGETAFALDVFEQQAQNIDNSGKGDRQIFEGNIRRVSHDVRHITIYAGDSLDVYLQRRILETTPPVRIFSVDGGHTAPHAINDLKFAASCLVNGGAVLLDDFCNIGWPGVTEGVLEYLREHPPIAPVLSIGGKLVLVSLGFADAFRLHVRKGGLIEGYRMKRTVVAGHDVPWVYKR